MQELMQKLNPEVLGKFNLTRSGNHAYLIDEENLTYYSNLDCSMATIFCKKHCYARKYPQGELDTSYRLSDFHPDNIEKVFADASRISFFGRGTLSGFDVSSTELITTLGNWYPNKTFKFYVRKLPKNDFYAPKNCWVHIALDHSSNIKIEDILLSKAVRIITVIEHQENEELISLLADLIKTEYCFGKLCSECLTKPEYKNFTSKLLLIQNCY